MNLEKMNLVEMSSQEVKGVEGGNWVRAIERIGAAIGIYDALSDFKEGWDSVPNGGFRPGGGAGGSW